MPNKFQKVNTNNKINTFNGPSSDNISDLRKEIMALNDAVELWNNSSSADPNHPYLLKKQIKPYLLKKCDKFNNWQDNWLLVPIYSFATGEFQSLQAISLDRKFFYTDCPIKGGAYIFGDLEEHNDKAYICEGWATGATIHEITGNPVVVAFNCGNLKEIAEIAVNKYSENKFIIAADNDIDSTPNSGIESAQFISKSLGLDFVYPVFKKGDKGTDFNDLFIAYGADEVLLQLENLNYDESEGYINFKKSISLYDDLFMLDIPERKKILPWLPEGGLAMIYSIAGVGKTFFGISLAYAITSSDSFMNWDINNNAGVLYVDGEMDLHEMRKRIGSFSKAKPKLSLGLLSHVRHFEFRKEDLVVSNKTVQDFIIKYIKYQSDIKVIILDNLSSLCNIREDKSDDWRAVMLPFVIACRTRGISLIMIHHAGKDGQQRGTGAKVDHLDTVIELTAVDDDDGASFKIKFEKHRDCYGKEIIPRIAKLITDENAGYYKWRMVSVVASNKKKMIELLKESGNDGLYCNEIADELGITRAQISKYRKILIKEGIVLEGGRKMPLILSSLGKIFKT